MPFNSVIAQVVNDYYNIGKLWAYEKVKVALQNLRCES